MKDNLRRYSENSDDTCCSQDTTSTNVSEHYCFTELGCSPIKVEENNNNPNSRAVTFGLEIVNDTDLNACLQNTGHNETTGCSQSALNNNAVSLYSPNSHEPNQPSPSVYKQNEHRNGHCDTVCKLNSFRSKSYPNKCNSSQFSQLSPLLEQESAPSISSFSEASKDTSGYEIPIHHSKTYPQDIGEEPEYGGKHCACQQDQHGCPAKEYKKFTDDINAVRGQYASLLVIYCKAKKLFLGLAVIDLVLFVSIVTMVPIVANTTKPDQESLDGTTPTPSSSAVTNICFDCADLEFDPSFTSETLRGLSKRGSSCCFESITPVYLSLRQIFQKLIDEKIKELNYSVTGLQNNPLVNGNGVKQNFSTEYIIKRVLLLNTPKERTAIHLISAAGPPEMDETMSGVFHKLRWSVNSDKTIITGKAGVYTKRRDYGLDVQVQSEGYYFLYTRLVFKSKPGFRDVSISYSINRQRGSTSTYIHEAKERCVSRGARMEHSGVVEMVVHLSRYDVIFISISKADLEFLSTEDGAHMLGLFEL